jgi:hypothetical protein
MPAHIAPEQSCPAYVTLSYFPEGRSCPEERTVYATDSRFHHPCTDVDVLVDTAENIGWDLGEPLTILAPDGRELWTNRRY